MKRKVKQKKQEAKQKVNEKHWEAKVQVMVEKTCQGLDMDLGICFELMGFYGLNQVSGFWDLDFLVGLMWEECSPLPP